jgi:hypothetical protein
MVVVVNVNLFQLAPVVWGSTCACAVLMRVLVLVAVLVLIGCVCLLSLGGVFIFVVSEMCFRDIQVPNLFMLLWSECVVFIPRRCSCTYSCACLVA